MAFRPLPDSILDRWGWFHMPTYRRKRISHEVLRRRPVFCKVHRGPHQEGPGLKTGCKYPFLFYIILFFFHFKVPISPSLLVVMSQPKEQNKKKFKSSSKRAGKKRSIGPNEAPLSADYDGLVALSKRKGGFGQGSRRNPVLEDYSRQFILPGETAGRTLRMTPAEGCTQMCARVIHKTVDVDSATLPAGFTVVMRPDLTAPGFITAAAASVVPALPGNVSLKGNLVADSLTTGVSDVRIESPWYLADGEGQEKVSKLIPFTDALGVTHYGFGTSPGPAQQININCHFDSNCTIQLYYKLAGGNWTALTTDGLAGTTNGVAVTRVAYPLNAHAIVFSFLSANMTGHAHVDLSVTFPSSQITCAAVDTLAAAFPKYILDLDVTYGRVISMSVLATNTSPALVKGGNINVARVPWTHDVYGNLPEKIAILPDNRRCQGPAEKGGYAWWMPSQIDELEPNGVDAIADSYRQADFLLVNVTGWGGAGAVSSFRLQFSWLVEFYTKNQLFEKIDTPPMNERFRRLLHRLQGLKAACHNDDHWETFKSYVRSGAQLAGDMTKFLYNHQEEIETGLAILSALA